MRPKQQRASITEKGNRSRRLALSLVFAAAAVALGIVPVLAQNAPSGVTPPSAVNGPALNAPGSNAPVLNAPAENVPAPTGEAAPGSAGTLHPAGGETPETSRHEAGGAEAGHGEGEEAEEGGDKIENPTWITGLLKNFWFHGPATLNADGAVDESGQPVDGSSLKEKQVDYDYVDHHAKGSPKPHYDIHPVIGEVGKTPPRPGVPTGAVQVDGRSVTLVNPSVTFALQGMIPEALVISLLTALGLLIGALALSRNMQLVPGRRQVLVEMIYSFLDDFVHGLIGPTYKKYVPLIGTAFLYILIMNLVGLIPHWKSPTANINVTAGMAIVVIIYVQIEGLRVNGLKGYLMHFVGEPVWLAPLNFPLHIIGEVARVLSLSVRLFGNIFGEDVVIAILILLAGMFGMHGLIPFQFPMLFLAIFTSIVQAMVFSILTGVYIALMTTHEDHGHGHGPEGHGHGQGHDHDPELAPRPAV